MRVVVPVARHSDCPMDEEHMRAWQIVLDKFGVTDIICPEHGPITWFDQLEFESEEAAEAWRQSQATPPCPPESFGDA